ncbi:hypothetical protein C2G38_2226153 [Gigaspora rosea]|uniref:Uncharacterized protein n=1 Tax=Gigaspora rosea TaxID=44941 RepID=A0A397TYI5_9GLOM|nr:hypothetical protein C2G38_2226153 [Gigaspora rosea]
MSSTFESYIYLLEAQLNIKINEIKDLKKQLDLLNFAPDNWLAICNPVLVNFINTLIYNDSNNSNTYTLNEKVFKKIVAIDAIYGSRYKNYVSEINLAITRIKYSIARSKTIIDIDNYVISSGSYTKFVNWLESLAVENKPLPKGLLFLAFDNEQHGQHNYLDCGNNNHIFTITSWLCDLLTNEQYDKLYYIIPEMQAEHEIELKIYLSLILEELVAEKNKKFNIIDQAIKNQKVSQSKPLVIKPHTFAQEQNSPNTDRISITQQLNSEHNIVIPEMYVPDLLEFNPNSIENVKKIKKDFPWLILIPGALYKEMNMLKAFVELNWLIDIKQFASLQGYKTENQLGFFKKCADHHKSWDSIYWAKKQNDHIYILKFEQVLIPPVPSQKHWRIAASTAYIINMIGHVDNEILEDNNCTFKSLGGEHILSEQLKIFKAAAAALDKKNIQKKELIAIINSLLNSINTSDYPNYRGL